MSGKGRGRRWKDLLAEPGPRIEERELRVERIGQNMVVGVPAFPFDVVTREANKAYRPRRTRFVPMAPEVIEERKIRARKVMRALALFKQRELMFMGACTTCGKNPPEPGKRSCSACRERRSLWW